MIISIDYRNTFYKFLCNYFQIQMVDYDFNNDLVYEDNDELLANKLMLNMENGSSRIAQVLAEKLDILIHNITILLLLQKDTNVLCLVNPNSGNNENIHSRYIKNYNGVYTGRGRFKPIEEDNNSFFVRFLKAIIDFLQLESKKDDKLNDQKIHRAGRMYRGHSID